MAGHLRAVEHWGAAPDPDIRKRKRAMEKELLMKLAVKEELIEFHPVILSSRVDRAKFYVTLNYSRLSPPAKEVLPESRNPRSADDPALRQISNCSRRGPRDYILPNLVKPHAQIRVQDMPSTDTEYHARRAAANDRLTKFFGEWTAYNKMAFPIPVNRKPQNDDLALKRKISRGSLFHLAQGQHRRKSSSSTISSGSDIKKDTCPVPKSRNKMNRWKDVLKEVRLYLLASRMKLPEDLPRSELRIYVSSTPDLQEEREFLEEVVYPRLQERCEEQGLNCHVVDMRSGAGMLTNNLETFDLIEKELYQCRKLSIGPYFISLIGHVLDDQSLPGFLHKSVYEKIRKTLIKENIIGVEAFDDVYRLDSNRVPAVYIKQPIHKTEVYQSPEEVETILYNALSEAVSVIAKKKHNAHSDVEFYQWSAVVKEIEEGLLSCYMPRNDTLCFMVDLEQARDVVMENATSIQRLRHNVFHHYKQFASMDKLVGFKSGKKSVAYLRSISDTVESSVASLLRSRIHHQEYDIAQQLTEGSEAIQHVRVALSQAENNSGNENTLAMIKEIVDRTDKAPATILLWGQSGTGKTAVVSQVAKSSILWQPRRKVMFRSLGMTLRSSSLLRVLESLVRQFSILYSLNIELPTDMSLQQAVSVFCCSLNAVSAKHELCGDLLLILDQLEKLPDLDAHYLLYILNSLPARITLILTLQTPHPLFSIVKSQETVHAMRRAYMNDKEVCKHVTDKLKAIRRLVTSDQLQSALNALPSDITPLHAQMLLHLTRWWPSHTLPELKPFSDTPEANFVVFIESIETEVGNAFTRYALSFLASARHGLADQEILHLLSKDSDLLNEIKEENQEVVSVVDGYPYQHQISRLISRLGQFVTNLKLEGETVYKITAQSLVTAIASKYLSDSFFYTVHSRLANFFMFIRRGLLLSSKDISEHKHTQLSKYHWRMLRSIPYHLCHSSADTSYVWAWLKEKVFFNFAWLVNEVYSGCFNELLNDISYALDNVSLDPDIQYLQQLLISVRQTITHNPLSLAAVFASLNARDLRHMKDSVITVVNEARVWLKQVHLQALIPVSYTSDKTNRLMMKENSLFNVTDLKPIEGTDRLLVQRTRHLSVFHMLTCEEFTLATLSEDIISLDLPDEDNVVVLTVKSSIFTVEMFHLPTNKHVKTVPLKNSRVLWFDTRSLRTSYFGVSTSIKVADLERGTVKNVLTTKNEWAASCISSSKPETVLTVVIGNNTKIEATSVQDITETKSVTLKNEPSNSHCKPLFSTKDGRYTIYVTERQAVVIDCSMYKVIHTFTYNGLPLVTAKLSRSHEHIFLAYANGAITCRLLYSGNQTMVAQIKPKLQWIVSSKMRDRGRYKTTDTSQNDGHTEIFTTLVTSEDDHFLFCGTNLGHVYVVHVPTGLQVVGITTQQNSIQKIIYLTSKGHFQHIITMDATGTSHHWNLRPLLKQARKMLQDHITDEDLLNEEKAKLDLNKYFTIYEIRRNNRMFLNGPDIKAFYQTPPAEIFTDLVSLDPAFGVQNDWENTGTIADLSDHLMALACGNELSGVILTVSKDFRLAKWSLQTGSLVWTKRLPCQGEVILDFASVYYDQAVMVVQQARAGQGYGITVVYTGEGHSKIMSRDNVTSYWMSLDRTHVMLMCQDLGQPSGTRLYLWDLINTQEETCEWKHPTSSLYPKEESLNFTSVSPNLQSSVTLAILGNEVTKVQSKWSNKHTEFNRHELDLHSAHDPDYNYLETNYVNSVDNSRRSSMESKHSMSGRKMHKDSVPLLVDELQKLHDSLSPAQGATSSRPDSAETSQNMSNYSLAGVTVSSAEKSLLKNVKTYLCWAEVSTDSFRARDAKGQLREAINDEATLRIPDKSKPQSGSKTSSASSKHRTNDKVQHTINVDSQSMPTSVKQNQENNIGYSSKVNHSEVIIPLQVASVCFVGEQDILVGTSSRHVLMLSLPTFHPIYGLGQHGPKLGDEITETFLNDVLTPHKDVVTYVTTSEDLKVLISSDHGVVCLWDAQNRTLTMKIDLTIDQKISHMVLSKDAVIVAMATNSRIIRLWTPVERREVASYMTTFDIVDLQMTCDCRKVVVRGIGPENKPILEIFDILNIDDVLMHVTGRWELQQHERREHLTNERNISRQHMEPWRKSSTLNVIDESL